MTDSVQDQLSKMNTIIESLQKAVGNRSGHNSQNGGKWPKLKGKHNNRKSSTPQSRKEKGKTSGKREETRSRKRKPKKNPNSTNSTNPSGTNWRSSRQKQN